MRLQSLRHNVPLNKSFLPVFRPYLNCFDQDDPFLIEAVKADLLHAPSTEPYNFTASSRAELLAGEYLQPVYLDSVIFKKKVKEGFFIEAGAHDFEQASNSLLFEAEHGWRGLLVEPNPTAFPKALAKQRRAWAANTCLATSQRPHVVHFSAGGETSQTSKYMTLF